MAGGRTRSAVVAVSTVLVCAVAVAGANAHPFSDWTGKSGPFRWHADLVSCGAVPGESNRIEAHTRWVDSPNNGYQRVSFRRQIRHEAATSWKTVASQTRSTRNTLEGLDVLLHWTQSFLPASSEEGRTSRDVLRFAWRRGREGSDRTVFARRVVLGPCVVG